MSDINIQPHSKAPSGSQIEKLKKPQGPIRWNAIIPFSIFILLLWSYFYFFFDLHVKKALEWAGYKALGTELNISEFKSSFIKGQVQISKLEITDAIKPEFNSLELENIRFDVKWDALLRLKFVVEEIAVDGIQFMSQRAHIGKVAPVEIDSSKPSFTQQLEDKALNKLEKDNQSNVLSNISVFLKTGQGDQQIKNLESQLVSKKLLQDANQKWSTKKTEWDSKIKTLPTNQELQSFKTRFESIKYKDFKNPQELDISIKQFDSLIKDVDAKNQQLQNMKSQLQSDLKDLDQDYKNIDAQVKKDIDALKAKFKIPKIDAASFAQSLFLGYLTPIMSKLDHYKALAEKYLPPKYSKMLADKIAGTKVKTTAPAEDDSIQPHPRSKGISYEFPTKFGYPLFWIQKINISSKSNHNADYGDFAGLIQNITSNQRQINKITTLDISGDFKKMKVSDIKINAELNNLKEEPEIKFNFNVGSFQMTNLYLLKSTEGEISIPQSTASFISSGQTVGFRNYSLRMNTNFSNATFKITTADKTISEVLTQTLNSIHQFNVEVAATGELKDLKLDIRSSLGGALQASFESLLKNKIVEANLQLQNAVNNEIGKLKSQLTTETDGIKNQTNSEVAKVQNQVNDQKKMVDARINIAKKDFEHQAQKQLEDAGKKGLDDLKKKFGL